MPSLILTNKQDRDRAGRAALGTRAFIKRFGSNPTAGSKAGVQLTGVRDFRGPNIITTPIVGSHHQSKAGFVQNRPGLRDAGTMDFDANFYPEGNEWQYTDQNEGGFMSSLMGGPLDEEPLVTPMCELVVVPPSPFRSIIWLHCYASMFGPGSFPMEGMAQVTLSVKASGRPYIVKPGNAIPMSGASAIPNAINLPNTLPIGSKQVYRFFIPGKYDLWSSQIDAASAISSIASTHHNFFNAAELAEFNEALEASDRWFAITYRALWGE